MRADRTATFGPAPDDETVWLLRCDSSLNWVLSRFAPAVLDPARHAYLIRVDHVDAFRTFCKLHAIALEDPPQLTREPTYQPPPFHAPVRTEAELEEQRAINARGIRKVRQALAEAARRREQTVRSWDDW